MARKLVFRLYMICKQGETQSGKVTVTLERGRATLITKGVAARVCENCGEAYLDEIVSGRLLELTENALRAGVQRAGVQIEVRGEYVAA